MQGQSPCPCTLWDKTEIPTETSVDDANAIEVGVKFQTEVDGFITSIRFYKGSRNIGTHLGNLWSSDGEQLATATFVNETASGWQQVDFAAPVPVKADMTYVASYHTTVGFYAADTQFFGSKGVTNGPLQALAEGMDGNNGVFKYGPSAFPTDSFDAGNYWVDVVFVEEIIPDTEAPMVSISEPAPGTVVTETVRIQATVTDNVRIAGVQFLLDGENLEAEDVVAPYATSWNTTSLPVGDYALAAIAPRYRR